MVRKLPVLVSYVISIALAFVISIALSGCRLGNNSPTTYNNEQEDPRSNTFDGEYDLIFTGITTCVDVGEIRCFDLDETAPIPSVVGLFTSNPVQFEETLDENNKRTGGAYLSKPGESDNRLPVYFNAKGEFAAKGKLAKASYFTKEQLCPVQPYLHAMGEIEKDKDNRSKTDGRITLDIKVSHQLEDEQKCHDLLEIVVECMNDYTQCGQDDYDTNVSVQDSWWQFFSLYLDNNLLTVEEIADLRGWSQRTFFRPKD